MYAHFKWLSLYMESQWNSAISDFCRDEAYSNIIFV